MSASLLCGICIFVLFIQSSTASTNTTNHAHNETTSITSTSHTESHTMNCYQQNCAGKELDATTHPSFKVQCGDSDCKASILFCPLGPDTSCHILCEAENACQDMMIWANDTGSLNIDCQTVYSCRGIEVHAGYASQITIHAENHGAFASGTVWASHAGSLQFSCVAADGNSACEDSTWNIGRNGHNTHFNCYGTGCLSMNKLNYMYAESEDMDGLNGEIVSCEQCDTKQSCLGSWTITCKCDNCDGYYITSETYGSSCGSDCGCNDLLDAISFSDTRGNAKCLYEGIDTDESSPAATMMSTAMSVGVCLCCVVGIVYYVRHRGNSAYYSPAGGARPATMQAVSQPVATQPPVMQPPQQVIMQQPMQQHQVVMMQPMQQPQVMMQQQQPYIQAVPQQQMQYYPQQQAAIQPLQPQYGAPIQPYAPSAPGPASAEGAVTNM